MTSKPVGEEVGDEEGDAEGEIATLILVVRERRMGILDDIGC